MFDPSVCFLDILNKGCLCIEDKPIHPINQRSTNMHNDRASNLCGSIYIITSYNSVGVFLECPGETLTPLPFLKSQREGLSSSINRVLSKNANPGSCLLE